MDWVMDATMIPTKYGPGYVHLGFLLQFEEQQADLNTHLDALVKGGVDDILITGHSLGGALSWIATYYIKNRYPSVNVEVITFASPLTADNDFMNWIYSNVKYHEHIVYKADPVPCLPPGYAEPQQIRHYAAEWQTFWWGWDTWHDRRVGTCWFSLGAGDHSMFYYCAIVGAGVDGCPGAYDVLSGLLPRVF
jgi:hypothetical protein